MNEEGHRARRPPDLDIAAADSDKRPARRWWDHPKDLSDIELMLAVRSMVAVDHAVDHRRRAA
jgi:hypothetical protein